MKIFAIDPGQKRSAFVLFDGVKILDKGILENNEMINKIKQYKNGFYLAIEMIQPYGQRVGLTVFETILWIGRFYQQYKIKNKQEVALIYKKIRWKYNNKEYLPINKWLCGNANVNDADIRHRLIDKFGEPGNKNNPGILYGIKKDIWSALAVAVTFYEQVVKK